MPEATLFFTSFMKPVSCPAPYRHNRYHSTADLKPHRACCHGNMKPTGTGNKCSHGYKCPGPLVLPSPSPPLEKRRNELFLLFRKPSICFEKSPCQEGTGSSDEGPDEMQSILMCLQPFPKAGHTPALHLNTWLSNMVSSGCSMLSLCTQLRKWNKTICFEGLN